MSDVPSGEWSALLVGHQWPDAASVAALVDAARHRATTAAIQTEYAESLRTIRTVTLANQLGATAEIISAAFKTGEHAARSASDANATKQAAYGSAIRHAGELRNSLTEIANRGNSEIESILASHLTQPDKLSAIVTTIVAAQTHANAKAAECSSNLFETIQSVCATGPQTTSARQFATSNGVDLERAFGSPDAEHIKGRVEQILQDQPASMSPTSTTGAGTPATTVSATTDPGPQSARQPATGPAGIPEVRQGSPTEAIPSGRNASAVDAADRLGVPISADAEAIPTTASNSAHAPAPSDSPGPTLERTNTSTTNADVVPPHEALAAQRVVNLSVATPLSPSIATPAGNVFTTTRVATPPGQLIPYGADLKPTAVTPSTAPTTIPAAPGSAPIGPAAGAGSSSPTALVRRPRSVITSRSEPITGSPERAWATVPTDAGTNTARAATRGRLHRILAAVARQQPQLLWAIGNLVDNTTVLVTDLAGGWIPPHIDIPVGVDLLRPDFRRRNLAALLGEATLTAVYEPGQPLDPDPEPLLMSIRSRDTAGVDDLGWKLSQATKWRDGLPRLAHTLARAASAQTGYLDTEVQLLREHLRAVAQSVLDRYPAGVNAADIGNWQLLGAIEALITGEKISANYHFAWFLAQAPQPESHR